MHINMWVDYWIQDVVDLGNIIVWKSLLDLEIRHDYEVSL
jgi:hypothetical protein